VSTEHSGDLTGGLAGHGLAAMRGERLIFADIDFAVSEGQALTLTGRNGAGKSTLLRMIAGLTKPFAGQITWRGQTAHTDREAFAAASVYSGHKDGLKTALSAIENLTMAARLSGHDPEGSLDALGRFGIADLAGLPVGYMSAGQRRRVALARLLQGNAPLWLLDEPLTAIDAASIDVLGKVMSDHLSGGGLIVAATHAPLPGINGDVLDITPPDLADDWLEGGEG